MTPILHIWALIFIFLLFIAALIILVFRIGDKLFPDQQNGKVTLSEIEFKRQYVSTFLATHAANQYVDVCMKGQHDTFNHQPIEDAFDLADRAWKSYVDLKL